MPHKSKIQTIPKNSYVAFRATREGLDGIWFAGILESFDPEIPHARISISIPVEPQWYSADDFIIASWDDFDEIVLLEETE